MVLPPMSFDSDFDDGDRTVFLINLHNLRLCFQACISWYCTVSWFSFFATRLTYEKGSFEMPVRKDHCTLQHVLSLWSGLRKQHRISRGGLSDGPPAYAIQYPGRVIRTQIYQSPEKYDVCDEFLLTALRQCLTDYLTLLSLTNSSQIWPSEEWFPRVLPQ